MRAIKRSIQAVTSPVTPWVYVRGMQTRGSTVEQPEQQSLVQPIDQEWVALRGGELEGRCPRTKCPSCRLARSKRRHSSSATADRAVTEPVCFLCYRAGLERERSLRSARTLFTGSQARFRHVLPLEPVDRKRLVHLRSERVASRRTSAEGIGQFAARRRRAQVEARHQLLRIETAARPGAPTSGEARALWVVARAAELQLPESWLPFVVSG